MALAPGTRLGVYDITAQIGVGGMGEVYCATDSNLKRSVAIKVLPAPVAGDADRLARFQREAEVLAALNHPNIAAIYGLEKTPDCTALVMELVDGDDLSRRIARGALPIAEAIPIAKQIAEALEAAHEQGIIHRDLKPANIKLRADGTVKVLDFGLAKAMEPAATSSPSVSMSPTLSLHATQAGVILGTAAYMSPEQAKGKPVDKRADIWAFGVVLHEMLTGQHLFTADTIPETLAHVMTRAADLGTLPDTTPRRVRDLIARCLEKDPKRRLRDIGEARLVLDDPAVLEPDVAPSASATAVAAPLAPTWRRVLPWSLAGVLGVGLVVALWQWAPWRVAPAPALVRLSVEIGADASLAAGVSVATLSPDGQTLAFVASPKGGGPRRLFVRRLDALQATALAGTEGAFQPFFSPDGRWLGFLAGGKINKVSVAGGAAVPVCDAPTVRGATWVDDDTIVFAPSGGPNSRLMRVSSAGGTPELFSTLDTDTATRGWPQGIAGRLVLYTQSARPDGFDDANLVVAPAFAEASAGQPLSAPKIVLRGGYYGRYLPSGHLVYLRQGTLFAVRFDLDRLETVGQAVPVLEGVAANSAAGGAQVTVSATGTLAYVPGTVNSETAPIDWMTRDGNTSVLRAVRAVWSNPRFSPDGQKLALAISDGKQRDIWIYDWARDTLTQLTFDANQDGFPVWTPDGRRMAFASDRARPGTTNLYLVNADGTGGVTRLTDSPNTQRPESWHPDGRILAYVENVTPENADLMTLVVDGDAARGWKPGKSAAFLATPAVELNPTFSPDGRWIAYFGYEAGAPTFQVYVRPFPGPGGQRRISTGLYPRWSTTSRELVFLDQRKIMVAPYTVAGESFQADKPHVWSPTSYVTLGTSSPYDLHPDGQRVAALAERAQAEVADDKIVLLFNFFDELNRLLPRP